MWAVFLGRSSSLRSSGIIMKFEESNSGKRLVGSLCKCNMIIHLVTKISSYLCKTFKTCFLTISICERVILCYDKLFVWSCSKMTYEKEQFFYFDKKKLQETKLGWNADIDLTNSYMLAAKKKLSGDMGMGLTFVTLSPGFVWYRRCCLSSRQPGLRASLPRQTINSRSTPCHLKHQVE